jgi:hypothetical protein
MMIYNGPKDDTREPHWLEKVTVSEYISKHIFSGDGTVLFKGVHPTINNTKEFCMPLHHFEEAKEWAEVGIGESCLNMNEVSINLVFVDPEDAILETYKDNWQPYYRSKEIPTTLSRSSRIKRARANTPARNTGRNDSTPSTGVSYAGAVKTNTTTVTPENNQKIIVQHQRARNMLAAYY